MPKNVNLKPTSTFKIGVWLSYDEDAESYVCSGKFVNETELMKALKESGQEIDAAIEALCWFSNSVKELINVTVDRYGEQLSLDLTPPEKMQ